MNGTLRPSPRSALRFRAARVAARRAVLLLLALFPFAVACRHPPAPSGPPIRVLFLGNSFTSTNDLPGMVKAIAASRGRNVEVDSVAPGGHRFQDKVGDAATTGKIGAGNWTFVVLQEQSQWPALEEARVEAEVIAPALRLDAMIHEANPAATTLFFETWGRRDGDAMNCAVIPENCSYEGNQRRISATCAKLAERTSGKLAPVGTAWARVRASHPEIDLYAGDGVHPSAAGTYLAACVFFDAIVGLPSAGGSALEIPVDQAAILRKTADEVVLGIGGR